MLGIFCREAWGSGKKWSIGQLRREMGGKWGVDLTIFGKTKGNVIIPGLCSLNLKWEKGAKGPQWVKEIFRARDQERGQLFPGLEQVGWPTARQTLAIASSATLQKAREGRETVVPDRRLPPPQRGWRLFPFPSTFFIPENTRIGGRTTLQLPDASDSSLR